MFCAKKESVQFRNVVLRKVRILTLPREVGIPILRKKFRNCYRDKVRISILVHAFANSFFHMAVNNTFVNFISIYLSIYRRNERKKKVHTSRWYILFLELWEVSVRENSKIVGAFLVGVKSCVLFLSITTNYLSTFPLNQTTSLTYSHFVQTIPTVRMHMYLIDHLNYLLRNSRIVRYNSGTAEQSKNSYFAQDNPGIVLILTLRRTYI